jgi:hypothetical protein
LRRALSKQKKEKPYEKFWVSKKNCSDGVPEKIEESVVFWSDMWMK